ncbi:hypothetical protein [Dyella amyloliquefaciens]|uniref:hypothetical protein n=1 Tax=Dyella amyloliquefaciens TaxID=1770545 RepID=UPI0013EE5124|nr:hypothetical protein [Dyella amyloliquefaciens]
MREKATGRRKSRCRSFASSQTSAHEELHDEGGFAVRVKNASNKRKNARTHFVDIAHQARGTRQAVGRHKKMSRQLKTRIVEISLKYITKKGFCVML